MDAGTLAGILAAFDKLRLTRMGARLAKKRHAEPVEARRGHMPARAPAVQILTSAAP
jgi:hypothetical protein